MKLATADSPRLDTTTHTPFRHKPVMSSANICRLVQAIFFAVIVGCGVAPQPDSIGMVAAFEVPLQSKVDRDRFLSVLRTAAALEGMHVDAEGDSVLENDAKVSPNFRRTINAAVWRGSNDEEAVASAMDQFDHLGQVWLIFLKGQYR